MTPPETLLRNAAEVRRLAPQEAAQGRPLTLRGVVTFFDLAQFSRFMQDGSAGIHLTDFAEYPELKAGDEIIVTGVTDSGDYAPVVRPQRVEQVGSVPLPEPRRVQLEDLASGREDSQWVEVRGMVRRVLPAEPGKSAKLELATGGGRLQLELSPAAGTPNEAWVDRLVRVRGVCTSSFNRGRQLFRSRLLVARPEDLIVENPPAPDPIAQPAQPLDSLLRFAPQGSPGHRIKMRGTVVHHLPGKALFVDDGRHGLEVLARQNDRLEPGEVVEVLGFPEPGEYSPVLADAVWRKMEQGLPPVPLTAPVDDLLSGAMDCRLVTLAGRLVDRTTRPGETHLIMETDGVLWDIRLQNPADFPDFGNLANGSRLRITGVCRLDVGADWSGGEDWRARGFHLLARTPADLLVTERPPWWTLTRLPWITGLLLTAVPAALTWAGLLRRKVRQQTQTIRRQLDSEASHGRLGLYDPGRPAGQVGAPHPAPAPQGWPRGGGGNRMGCHGAAAAGAGSAGSQHPGTTPYRPRFAGRGLSAIGRSLLPVRYPGGAAGGRCAAHLTAAKLALRAMQWVQDESGRT